VWVVVAGILLCLGAPLLLIGQQLRQESLNAALVLQRRFAANNHSAEIK